MKQIANQTQINPGDDALKSYDNGDQITDSIKNSPNALNDVEEHAQESFWDTCAGGAVLH